MTQANTWYSIRRRSAVAAAALAVVAAGAGAQPSPATAPPAASAEILIYSDIGESSWWADSVSASQFVRELAALDVQQITVRINSMGGSVPDGIAIYNAIRRHPAHVTTIIDGVALSVASLVAMAGDTVEMAENAVLMVHAPWTGISGNAQALRERADVLDQWAHAMATSYAAKAAKPMADMLALLTDGADHYYTAAQAQAEGFVDVVASALPVAAMARLDARAMVERFPTLPTWAWGALQPSPAQPSTQTPAQPAQQEAASTVAAATPPVASATHSLEITMPGENKGAPGAAPAVEAAARDAVLAVDQQRRADVRARFAPFMAREGVAEPARQCEDDHSVTVQAAAARLLEHLGSSSVPIQGSVHVVQDSTDKRREAMAASVMARAGQASAQERQALGANPFRGHTLLDLARACAMAAGVRVDGMDKMQIVAAAFTTSSSDFPVLLENVMHKTLQGAYALQPLTWRNFCAVGSVSDFRAHNRYRVGSLSNLDPLNELGEFRNKAIPDGERASVSVGTKGNIINMSRQMVINDDLGAFTGLATALGRAAARSIEADVFAALALNSGRGPTLADGKALFHEDHGNLVASGGAPSVAQFTAIRRLMASQRDVSGNDYLDIMPSVLLAPLAIGPLAAEVNGQEYNDESNKNQRKPNVVRGMFSQVLDTPRLSGTAYIAFAEPGVNPVLEVSFLDGNETPYLELEQGFTVDGARYKVRHDWGVSGVDFRGAVLNPGA